MKRTALTAIALVLVLLTVPPVGAQMVPATEERPAIAATGRGEVLLAPDLATVSISIRTIAPDAASASSRNERIAADVVVAIEGLDLAMDSVRLTGLRVYPNREYTRDGPRDAGFAAERTISITTDDVSDVGPIVSAALGAGATEVGSIAYSSSRADEAREQALAAAVRNARADAEVVAEAAGGTLGGVLLITTQDVSMPRPMLQAGRANDEMAEMAAQAALPDPSDLVVTAYVSGRWAFVEGE